MIWGISPNKYHARRTWSELTQRWYASKAEANRGEELALLERGGGISGLAYQVKYVLCKRPRITITIDFAYIENGARVHEDTKGVLTRDTRTKLAWLEEKFGVKVILSR